MTERRTNVATASVPRSPIPDARVPRVLVIDADETVHGFVRARLAPLGYEVESAAGCEDGLAKLRLLNPDIVVIDAVLTTGDDMLDYVRTQRCGVAVIVTSTLGSAQGEDASLPPIPAECLRKPLDVDEFQAAMDRAFARRTLAGSAALRSTERIAGTRCEGAAESVDAKASKPSEFCGMVGRSRTMKGLWDTIRRLAPHVNTVLISGETGTGKKLVARAIHRLGSRSRRRFVPLNCAAVVDTLFESELFGHMRGAFTGATETKKGLFEHADGGTLFLDEVGELPTKLQAKLLRATEQHEVQRVGSLDRYRVDVCIIAATNRRLLSEVDAGRFRTDLFYRLSIIEIRLSPLRELRDDIPCLAEYFTQEIAQRLKRPITGVTPAAARLLQQLPWPGNVRELKNAIERACLLTENRILDEEDFDFARSPALSPLGSAPADPHLFTSGQREHIEQMLQKVGGNRTAAAHLLGLSRRSLYRWLDRLHIQD